ncbi:uncharacterized protein EI90DRAFT_952730 [Cantharellus anzutake]|uniref:uncharacterized protein n=1 Tax=Cantharellus anzutake TaxID=1750568 RepID=UPI001907D36C|nr:uncharacterized protein EI90DRAFT_952730 [Cantharellus anzutake]KAF8331620.1 hypothetical protein EI90DRAFT_952730 [Cantharellus anzutake]
MRKINLNWETLLLTRHHLQAFEAIALAPGLSIADKHAICQRSKHGISRPRSHSRVPDNRSSMSLRRTQTCISLSPYPQCHITISAEHPLFIIPCLRSTSPFLSTPRTQNITQSFSPRLTDPQIGGYPIKHFVHASPAFRVSTTPPGAYGHFWMQSPISHSANKEMPPLQWPA